MNKQSIKTQIFINECSLQGQFQSTTDFENAVRQFITLFTLIKQKEKFSNQLYKNDIFVEYSEIKNSPFAASLNTLKDKSLKNAFINIIFNKLNPINWTSERLHQPSDNYTLSDTSENVTNTSIAEVTERKLQQNKTIFLLVNFSNSNFQTSHQKYLLCQIIGVSKNQQPQIEFSNSHFGFNLYKLLIFSKFNF